MMERNSNNRSNYSSSNSSRSSSKPMMSGWASTAKERPVATAAAVGAAAAAGVFLWSRRNQISDQLSHMNEQISDWSNNRKSEHDSQSGSMSGRSSTPMGVESHSELSSAGSSGPTGSARATGGRSGKAQSGQPMSPSRTASPTSGL